MQLARAFGCGLCYNTYRTLVKGRQEIHMLHQRRAEIIDKVKTNRMVKVTDLMKEYQVSIETIRRDLEYLEQTGYLKRVYGGAVLHGLYGEEPTYAHREVVNYREKQAIGAAAAALVEDGDTLFVDVGTTTLESIAFLRDKKNLTIITNATLIAQEAVKQDNCRVILLGGELRPGELSVSGHLTNQSLGQFYANKLLMGIGGISLHSGVTDYHIEESHTRRIMLERSDTVIGVADYSKFCVTAMNFICPAKAVHKLVTDWSTPSKTVKEFRAFGLDVIVADPIQ